MIGISVHEFFCQLVIQFLYSGRMEKPSEQSAILEASDSAKIWVIICLSILFTTISTWIILQILKASEFFMLDSLKRRCECLAADYLDCDNVLDTYTFAKVKVAFVYMTLCLLDKFTILFGYSNFSCARQKNSFHFVKPSCLGILKAWWRSWISGMHWLITTKEMWVLSHDGLI